MHRYIAFAWDHRIEKRQLFALRLIERLKLTFPEWKTAATLKGLQVYQTVQRGPVPHAYLLDRGSGIVLGTLFASDAANGRGHEVNLGEQDSRKIRESAGRSLVEHFWGRYVALLKSDDSASVRVLRDPTGAMPCQITKVCGIDVVCSHIGDFAELGFLNCTINWDHVAAFLWFHRVVTRQTGLDGVYEVLAGECVSIGSDGTNSTFYWRPDRICDEHVCEDRSQALVKLRDVIERCVATWASCHGSILVELSGGLDSAVVLGCLVRASTSTKVIAQNVYSLDAEGDERLFARKAADDAGIEIFETPLTITDMALEKCFDAEKVSTPTLTHLRLEDMVVKARLIRAHNIDAIYSGQGGDHFFQRASTALIAAEYASRHGLGPGLLEVMLDTARFTKESIWTVMASVAISGLLGWRGDPYLERLKLPPFVSEATRDALAIKKIRHPWMDCAGHLPGSKVLQILDIVDSQNFYRVSNPYTDTVHPLISQPVIEQCLQIPCYTLTFGGIDRALVRQAFSEMIPPEIASRTSKGGTTTYVHSLFLKELPFLRELLLDGILVRQGLLDRAKVARDLSESSLVRDPRLLFPCLIAFQAEVWSRTWISTSCQAPT